MPALALPCSRTVIVLSPGWKGDVIFDHPGDCSKARTTLQAEEHEPERQHSPGPGWGTIQPGARPRHRGWCRDAAGREIRQVAAAPRDTLGTVVFIADDEVGAGTVLQDAGIGYTMRPALTIRMEHQPGAGAATFRKLAAVGVSADMLLPIRVSDDLFFAVICVDDAEKARRALGVQVIGEGDFAP